MNNFNKNIEHTFFKEYDVKYNGLLEGYFYIRAHNKKTNFIFWFVGKTISSRLGGVLSDTKQNELEMEFIEQQNK